VMADASRASSVAKSSKLRRCDCCYEPIQIGEPYEAYSWPAGTDFFRVTLHPECYATTWDFTAGGGSWSASALAGLRGYRPVEGRNETGDKGEGK